MAKLNWERVQADLRLRQPRPLGTGGPRRGRDDRRRRPAPGPKGGPVMSENIAVTHPAVEGYLPAPSAICRVGGARLDRITTKSDVPSTVSAAPSTP